MFLPLKMLGLPLSHSPEGLSHLNKVTFLASVPPLQDCTWTSSVLTPAMPLWRHNLYIVVLHVNISCTHNHMAIGVTCLLLQKEIIILKFIFLLPTMQNASWMRRGKREDENIKTVSDGDSGGILYGHSSHIVCAV